MINIGGSQIYLSSVAEQLKGDDRALKKVPLLVQASTPKRHECSKAFR